jgi:hypothetical protein
MPISTRRSGKNVILPSTPRAPAFTSISGGQRLARHHAIALFDLARRHADARDRRLGRRLLDLRPAEQVDVVAEHAPGIGVEHLLVGAEHVNSSPTFTSSSPSPM